MTLKVVQGLDQAIAAIAAGHYDLISEENAGAILGGLWFKTLQSRLHQDFPDAPITLHVHCGTAAGRVMECLKLGLKHIIFTGDAKVLQRLQSAAQQVNAHVTGP